MRKKRHHPNKPQNNYGSDYDCINFDTTINDKEFCHDEGQMYEYIKWAKCDKNNKLLCKGNRHNCLKYKLKWIASQKNNY